MNEHPLSISIESEKNFSFFLQKHVVKSNNSQFFNSRNKNCQARKDSEPLIPRNKDAIETL